MRTKFIIALGLSFLFGVTTVNAIPIVSVDADPFTPGVQSVFRYMPGDTLKIDVVIEGVEVDAGPFGPFNYPVNGPLNAFEFDLDFDPTILRATSITSGGFFGSLFPLGIALLEPSDINAPDVNYGEMTLGYGGFFGDGVLASISFDTIGVGTSMLDLNDVVLSAPFGNAMNVALNDASISPVPEPATLLLLGSGLIGLVARKRWLTK